MDKQEQKKKLGQRERSLRIFYASIVVLPLLQFLIFYVYVNFNSIKMAFWTYELDIDSFGYKYTFAGLDNFKEAWDILIRKTYLIKNSLTSFALSLGIGMPLALVFSFYIYKGYFGSKTFKVVLFLPNIISSLIFTLLFRYVVCDVYKEAVQLITGETVLGLLDNIDTKMPTIYFYNIWVSFGVNMLMYSGAMAGISKEVVEAGELDGVNIVQEFFLITLPLIYPTISSMLVISLTGIFTGQLNLHAFFGSEAEDMGTLGYYMFVHAQDLVESTDAYPSFSVMSSMGLITTFVMLPLILGVRKILSKVGPSEV